MSEDRSRKLYSQKDRYRNDPEYRAAVLKRAHDRYHSDPQYRAATVQRSYAFRRTEMGMLSQAKADLRFKLTRAVRDTTKARLRERIAALDGQIAALRERRSTEGPR